MAIIEKLLGTWFVTQLKQQGFSIGLLVLVSVVLFSEVRELKRDYKSCNTKMIELFETIVVNNTVVLTKVDEKLTCK